MKIFKFHSVLLLCVMGVCSVFVVRAEAAMIPSGTVVKASGPAVYYVFDGKRYAYPNKAVYESWNRSYDNIQTISDEELASLQLAGNVTFRPGAQMIKLTTDPKVYAIDGKQLRWVADESTAKKLYGSHWSEDVYDVSDSLFQDYEVGSAITSSTAYEKTGAQNRYGTFSSILGGYQSVYPSPDQISHRIDYELGYWAVVSSTPQEVAGWFLSNAPGWKAQYSFNRVATGTDGEIFLLNFTKSRGAQFVQRSIQIATVTDVNDGQYPYPVVSGQTNIIFMETAYPEGYLSYPYAFLMDASSDGNMFMTNRTREKVYGWFEDVGRSHGWVKDNTETAMQAFEDEDQDVLYLRNDALGKRMRVAESFMSTDIESLLIYGTTIMDLKK